MFKLLKDIRYKWLLFSEKKVMQLHSLNSRLDIEVKDYYYDPPMPGITTDIFYSNAYMPTTIVYEPMYYQQSVDKLVKLIYGSKERKIEVNFRCFRGYAARFVFIKNRKTIQLADYYKIAYVMRMLNRYAFPEHRYKRILKGVCRLSCKEKKRREKYGYQCFEV